jgi:hypothetical protein
VPIRTVKNAIYRYSRSLVNLLFQKSYGLNSLLKKISMLLNLSVTEISCVSSIFPSKGSRHFHSYDKGMRTFSSTVLMF